MTDDQADALLEIATKLTSDNDCESGNVVDGLFAIAKALMLGAKHLGNGDASTPMGALEALGKCLMDSADTIAHAIEGGLQEIADAVRESAESLTPETNGDE